MMLKCNLKNNLNLKIMKKIALFLILTLLISVSYSQTTTAPTKSKSGSILLRKDTIPIATDRVNIYLDKHNKVKVDVYSEDFKNIVTTTIDKESLYYYQNGSQKLFLIYNEKENALGEHEYKITKLFVKP